jgi:ubiquinone/menaquinone biosynthesis C-methylase UbiE
VERQKRAARDHFDARADRWERDRLSRWIEPVPREALAALELTAGDRFLDVGCGTGPQVRQAAPTVERAIGVDLSAAMIEQAAQLAHGSDHAVFAIADAERLPFPDGAFTAVLCTLSFHHYPDPRAAVREMARVLEPGGRLVIGDACGDLLTARVADVFLRRFEPGHVRLYRSAELGELLYGAGLSRVEHRRLMNGGLMIVRAVR